MNESTAEEQLPPVTENSKADVVGSRIKQARRIRGLTLKQLAIRVGCSPSALSKIENQQANPSLGMLNRICRALGMNIVTIFSNEQENSPVVTPANERRYLDTQGARFERMVPIGPGNKLQGHLAIINPGCYSEEVKMGEGEQVGYVVEGAIELKLDGETHLAKAGDSFFFTSTTPYSFGNPGKHIARVVWVNTPPFTGVGPA